MSAMLVGTLHFDMQASLNVYIGFWQQFTLKMTSEAISEHEFFPRRHASNPPGVVYVPLMLPHTGMVAKLTFSHQDTDLA